MVSKEGIFKANKTRQIKEYTQILNAFRKSQRKKIMMGWSRKIGAGFIAEDLEWITKSLRKGTYALHFKWNDQNTVKLADLNLRETEEAIKFLKQEMGRVRKFTYEERLQIERTGLRRR